MRARVGESQIGEYGLKMGEIKSSSHHGNMQTIWSSRFRCCDQIKRFLIQSPLEALLGIEIQHLYEASVTFGSKIDRKAAINIGCVRLYPQ